MATKVRPEHVTELPAELVERPDVTSLRDIVERVRDDSKVESDKYLDETVVPHGGE